MAHWLIRAEFRGEGDRVRNGPNPESRVNLLAAGVCSNAGPTSHVTFDAEIDAETGEEAVAESQPLLTHIALRMGFHELHNISAKKVYFDYADPELVHQ